MPFKKITQSQIKHLRSLQLKKYRQKYNQFIVEGTKSVLEFLNSSMLCVGMFAQEQVLENLSIDKFEDILYVANTKQMNQLSALKQSSGLLACFEIPTPQPISQQEQLVIALDDIRDPGNLGTIIRTADWFGLNQVICSKESVDCYNPKVIQSSMGSLSRVTVHYKDLASLPLDFPEHELMIADMEGEDYRAVSFERGILVIGNEGHGVSEMITKMAHRRVSIPRIGEAESLNAAISAAIILANWS